MAERDGRGARGPEATGGERRGILAWGTHLPHWRLDRATIAAVAGTGGGRGTRAVASYDEDATTLAVAAARRALAGHPDRTGHAPDTGPGDHPGPAGPPGPAVTSVWLATVSPPYLDRTNATVLHAALRLGRDVPAYDCVGSVRSTLGALRAGLGGSGAALVVGADLRTGRPGSPDEAAGGDGAAAVVVGPAGAGPVLAEVAGWGTATEELLDRWRVPGESWSRTWEDRFGEVRYARLAADAWAAALASAGLTPDDVDRVVVTGTHPRAVATVEKALGVGADPVVGELAGAVGLTGAAHPLLLLAAALEGAGPGEVIALVVVADGAEVVVVRTTPALAARPAPAPPAVRDQLGGAPLAYGTYLAWRGFLRVEPPRRPEPARPSAAAASRSATWKYALVASEDADGTVHLPPSPTDGAARPMADATGTVTTWTVDRLAYSPHPPVVFAVVDFDGGGRLPVELTDMTPDEVTTGLRVEMTFRRFFTADGIHNYFWKARPARAPAPAGSGR